MQKLNKIEEKGWDIKCENCGKKRMPVICYIVPNEIVAVFWCDNCKERETIKYKKISSSFIEI